MKVFVIGGGWRGTDCISDLIKANIISQVTVGDKQIEKVKERYAKQGIDAKVSFERCDIYDHDGLVRLIRGYDVAINCAGPFYLTAGKATKAAIEARVDYIDICDDVEGTQQTIALDQEARKAGVTVITGLGIDPGTCTMLAKYGANKLDKVDKIAIRWVASLVDPAGFASGEHVMHMLTGDCPQYLDGQLVYVPAGSGVEPHEFPEPLGKCEVYYVAHAEVITLPRAIPGVREVTQKGGLVPVWINQVYRDEAEAGLTSEKPLKVGEIEVVPHDVLMACRRAFPFKRDLTSVPTATSVDILVEGWKGGEPISYSYNFLAPKDAGVTGTSASIAAQMLCSGQIKVKGVYSAEQCIEPEAYFKELAKRNFPITIRETISKPFELLK